MAITDELKEFYVNKISRAIGTDCRVVVEAIARLTSEAVADDDGEVHLIPKESSTGVEGTIFYDSDDDHVYVATV